MRIITALYTAALLASMAAIAWEAKMIFWHH
jgi:hypothetical protein